MHNWSNKQKVKLSRHEVEDLCRKRRQGCEQANEWLYLQAFTLMLHQAKKLNALDEVDGFKERLDYTLDAYDPQFSLSTFICQRVRGFIQGERLRRSRERMAAVEYAEESSQNTTDESTEEYADKCSLYHEIHKRMAELPAKLQYILHEWYWAKKTLGEIARNLGCTLQYVHILRNKAEKILQKKMAAELK